MMDEIVLHDYRPSYLDGMYSLDQDCFSEEFRFDRESMRVFAEEAGAIVRVAVKPDEGIVGFVIVHLEAVARGRIGYVVTLDVATEYRRRGMAHKLLFEAEEGAAAAGARWMELHVFTGNEGAIHFYERSGYEQVGVRRRFYGKSGLDAFIYRRELKTT
jgi:ribosomal protein S18 acetylase RimI-like enzyme